MDTAIFTEKSSIVHNNKYNYSEVKYISTHKKVRILCDDHGFFYQTPGNHLQGSGCPKCAKMARTITTTDFINRANNIHGNKYDYTKTHYTHNQAKVTIICKLHGEFEQKPKIHLEHHGCPICRNRQSTFIKTAGIKFKNQHTYDKVKYFDAHTNIIVNCVIHGEFTTTPTNYLSSKYGCPGCYSDSSRKRLILSTSEFISRASTIHNNLYDYSHVNYIGYDIPITIICKEHGEFLQKPGTHIQGSGCAICGKEASNAPMTTLEFVDKATELHGNLYDYSLVKYIGGFVPVTIICKEHGEFLQKPRTHLANHGCSNCSAIQFRSTNEIEIANFIATLLPESTIITNNRQIIPPLELDIYIPEHNIAIEYNGTFWHSELQGKDRYYHISKTTKCNNKQIRLIHIQEYEFLQNKELVFARLKSILKQNATIYARKCEVIKIPNTTKVKLMNQYHIQRDCNSAINYALTFNDNIVAIMTFCLSRFTKKYQFELLRFCNTSEYNVVGGASKLMNAFMFEYNPLSIISYSDKRWNTGVLYTKLKFKYSHTSKPNYKYFLSNNTTKMLSRIQFQKHKLVHKLPTFNSSQTEWENMKNNGYNRIWDCGNDVYTWEKS